MEGVPGRADTPASAWPHEEACAGGQGDRQTRSARRTGFEALCSFRPWPLFDRLPNVLPPELEACKSHRPTDHRSSHSATSKDRAAPQRSRPWPRGGSVWEGRDSHRPPPARLPVILKQPTVPRHQGPGSSLPRVPADTTRGRAGAERDPRSGQSSAAETRQRREGHSPMALSILPRTWLLGMARPLS